MQHLHQSTHHWDGKHDKRHGVTSTGRGILGKVKKYIHKQSYLFTGFTLRSKGKLDRKQHLRRKYKAVSSTALRKLILPIQFIFCVWFLASLPIWLLSTLFFIHENLKATEWLVDQLKYQQMSECKCWWKGQWETWRSYTYQGTHTSYDVFVVNLKKILQDVVPSYFLLVARLYKTLNFVVFQRSCKISLTRVNYDPALAAVSQVKSPSGGNCSSLRNTVSSSLPMFYTCISLQANTHKSNIFTEISQKIAHHLWSGM